MPAETRKKTAARLLIKAGKLADEFFDLFYAEEEDEGESAASVDYFHAYDQLTKLIFDLDHHTRQ
jgi:hypothetical protein